MCWLCSREMTLPVPSWPEESEQNDEPTNNDLLKLVYCHWEDEFMQNCHVYIFYMLITAVCLQYLRWQDLCLWKINKLGDGAYIKYELLYIIVILIIWENSNLKNAWIKIWAQELEKVKSVVVCVHIPDCSSSVSSSSSTVSFLKAFWRLQSILSKLFFQILFVFVLKCIISVL